MKGLGFEHCVTDTCVVRFKDEGSISTFVMIHVDDASTIGHSRRYDSFCEDLNCLVPTTTLADFVG